jgi:hypothetical protein
MASRGAYSHLPPSSQEMVPDTFFFAPWSCRHCTTRYGEESRNHTDGDQRPAHDDGNPRQLKEAEQPDV